MFEKKHPEINQVLAIMSYDKGICSQWFLKKQKTYIEHFSVIYLG